MRKILIFLAFVGLVHANCTRDDDLNIVSCKNTYINDLMWDDDTQVKRAKLDFREAYKFCKKSKRGNYTDWRMPTMAELRSIVDFAKSKPAVKNAFVSIKKDDIYWSITRDLSLRGSLWRMNFAFGRDEWGKAKNPAYVKCVRVIEEKQKIEKEIKKEIKKEESNKEESKCPKKIILDIEFPSYENRILKSQKNKIKALYEVMKENPSCSIELNGYTDSSGGKKSNQRLSLKRAKSVKKYLIKLGATVGIKAEGYGEKDPVASNDTLEGRTKNKRIEVVFTPIKKDKE